jgi:Kef-type K+ transport system membrane component KefB
LPESYKKASQWVEAPTLHYLLPFFVVTAGLSVKLGVGSSAVFSIFATLASANILGQIVGTLPFARLFGFSWRHAIAITAFMTCKGIMEFALAKILLDGGIISVELYNSAIVMAIFLTAITSPIAWLTLQKGLPTNDWFEIAPVTN